MKGVSTGYLSKVSKNVPKKVLKDPLAYFTIKMDPI
jgi:hypothetical protein